MTATGSERYPSTGGASLFGQWWSPAVEAKAVVAIVHGYAEHSGRYAQVAADLNAAGYAVEALDLRGHGQSSGERVSVQRFEEFLDDVDAFLARVRERHPGRDLFLLGHSMGGGVVTLYTILRKPSLDGVLLSGAALLSRREPPPPEAASQPRAPLPASAISRDPAVVAAYENDPLVYRGPGTPAMMAAFAPAGDIVQERMGEISLPLLIMHGTADLLVPYPGSEQLMARAASKDKTLRLYDGLYHEILNEPERGQVLRDIIAWLDARAG